jgi:hypothetical protein
MRTRLLVAGLALALAPLAFVSASAAPMSTSDLLKPERLVEEARCYRYCYAYGYCGYRHNRYKCCKVWKTRCSYGYKRRYY